MEKHKVCSFFGHRKIEETEELKIRLQNIIVSLIEKEDVKTFLLGSKSDFNFLCHAVITEIKKQYSNIERCAYTIFAVENDAFRDFLDLTDLNFATIVIK